MLLILVGVTIASITGENGILSKATQASQKTTQEKEREEIKMAVTSDNMKDITGDERESEDDIENFQKELDNIGVRIDIWTHLMRGCIINYVH